MKIWLGEWAGELPLAPTLTCESAHSCMGDWKVARASGGGASIAGVAESKALQWD